MYLAEKLDLKLVPVTTRSFKDKELCPRIHTNKRCIDDVIYCSRKTPEENPNDYFSRFLLTAAGLKKAGAEVTAVMPYLVYARQDKDFVNGNQFEPKSIEILLETMTPYINALITFNAHFQREHGVITSYALPVHNIDCFEVFNKELKDLENAIIMAPDKGMLDFAKKLSKTHSIDFDFMLKTRNRDDGCLVFEDKDYSHIKNKIVVIPDDMYSSCGTMITTCGILRKYQPKKICTMAIHGAFTPGAYEQLKGVSDGVLFTDTIINENATHGVSEKLADYMAEDII